MQDYNGKIIDFGIVPRSNRERLGADIVSERIRNLAFQASKLPTTLSLSEIEELGLAVLNHARRYGCTA